MNAAVTQKETPEPYKLPIKLRFSLAAQPVAGRNAVAPAFLDRALTSPKATYMLEGRKLANMLAEMVEGEEDLLGQMINGAQASTLGKLQMRPQPERQAALPTQPVKTLVTAFKRGLGL